MSLKNRATLSLRSMDN